MKLDEIYAGFLTLFPEWGDAIEGYSRLGSRAITLYFKNTEKTLVFYYNNLDDWSFGTRMFRRPGLDEKKGESK